MSHTKRSMKMVAIALLIALGFTVMGTVGVANAQGGNGNAQPTRQAIVRQLAAALLEATENALNLTQADIVKELGVGKTLADVIKAHNGNVTAIKAAAKTALTDKINQAVTDGKITQRQADALLVRLDTALDRMVNAHWPGQGNRRARLLQGAALGVLVRETAKETNLPQRDLLKELRSGKTLRQIATEHKADPTAIINAAVTNATTALNKLVANGKLKQDQANTLIAGLQGYFTKAMDTPNPLRNNNNANGDAPAATPVPEGTPSL
jgi:hypothetical protein